ncbi:CBS domain-containing protein [Paralimibaculum aggregatum]|uniref:CBS domain-containing protein n=1 Tax=Paralimibaculum aggregatum TaxID=3036245 RepID=A0ABQ6LQG1_9RHOB|nr:CBS domain-containing protein [Limibaculum sp. NKW23]GMG83758.1 CBS domain-containing protein [Limibaculum sp. NKW23]
MKVEEILKAKGQEVVTVRPSESIATFAHRLRMAGIGAMIVSEDGARMDGIISERDVVRGLAEYGANCLTMAVSNLMTSRVVTCGPADSIAQIARLMTQNRIRHLPVVDGRRLVGLVSIGDVVKHRFEEMELEAHVLRDIATASR